MKLLVCTECQDVFKLTSKRVRKCACGKSRGKYEKDGLNAWYSGPCVPIGFANSSLAVAIEQQPEKGLGKVFRAFVIPKECDTFTNRDIQSVRAGSSTSDREAKEDTGTSGLAKPERPDKDEDKGRKAESRIGKAGLDKFKTTGDLKDCPLVRCNKCGWVHFAVTWVYALRQTAEFNQWYNKQSDETKSNYGGEANIDGYLKCFRCGGDYKDCREAKPAECPRGSTIQPILHYSEETLGLNDEDDVWLNDWPWTM